MTNQAYNAAYTPAETSQLRSANDRIPQATDGTGETARLAIGDRVQHRISGQQGEVVDLHADPFVKEVTHGVVNWTGDGDGYGQGYANTNLIKF